MYEIDQLKEIVEQVENSGQDKLANQRAKLRPAGKNEGERCKFCDFFNSPTNCKIIEGPVDINRLCNWIQSRKVENIPQYKIADEDWLAFGRGMMKKQPYQHKVVDVANTPAGSLLLIEDSAEPSHYFSLSKSFHIEHTSLEHHWSQEEADQLIAAGLSNLK